MKFETLSPKRRYSRSNATFGEKSVSLTEEVDRCRGLGVKLRCRKLKTLEEDTQRLSLLIAGNTTQETGPQNENRKDISIRL